MMTNDYEKLRTDVLNDLLGKGIDPDTIQRISSSMDYFANFYHIEYTGTDISADITGWYGVMRMYINSLGVENKSVKTLKTFVAIITQFFKIVWKDINSITTNDCRAYLHILSDPELHPHGRAVSDRTRDEYRTVMQLFFKWCIANGYRDGENPFDKVAKIKVEHRQRKYLTKKQVEIVRRNLEGYRENFIFEFLLSTGCRISELVALKKSDVIINDDYGTVHVLGKGKKHRTVYLNPRAILAYDDYMRSRTDDSPFVLVSTRGSHEVTTNSIQQLFNAIKARIGEEFADVEFTPHIIRHTFATLLRVNGCPMEDIQKMLGHESIDTTNVYAETTDELLESSHKRYATA